MIKFKNYPLFWKLSIPVIFTTLIWSLVISMSGIAMKKSQTHSHDLYTNNVAFVLQLQALQNKLSEINSLLLSHVSSADGRKVQELTKKFHAQQANIDAEFQRLEKTVVKFHNHTATLFLDSHKAFNEYMTKSLEVIQLSQDFEKLPAFEKLQEINLSAKRPIDIAFSNIMSQESVFMDKSYHTTQQAWRRNLLALFVAGGSTFVLSLLFLYWILKKVINRMSMVATYANTLQTGDLSAQIEPDGDNDEISYLGTCLSAMAGKIQQSTTLNQKSEEKIRTLLDSTAEAIYGIDTEGMCTFANKAFLQILGYESDAHVIGQNIHNLIHHTYPDGTPYPLEECPISRSLFTGEKTHRDNEVLWRKDGSNFKAEYRSHPILKNGNVVEAVVSFLDITERKLTEEALIKSHNLLKDSQEIGQVGSWEWDINKNTIHWSDEIYRIFGFLPYEVNPTYDIFLAKIHPDDRPLVENAVQNALEGKESYNIQHRIYGTDGQERIVNEKGKVYYDETGNPTAMIGTVQDITDIKKIENDLRTYQGKLEVLVSERTAELQNAKEEADKANQAKSLFLSSMSHELRTPLNSILGFGQLLSSDEQYPLVLEQKNQLQKIINSGRHLLSLIDEVLNLSKIEANTVNISIEPVNAYTVVLETIDLAQETAKKQQLKITATEPDKNIFIAVDSTRFRQIIMNLLSNAIKYNRPGGSVNLSCEEHNDLLRVIVSDTGYGISSEKSSLVFEPFNRLGAETSSIEGTGIGLTITKRLVELMDGQIGFESEVDTGTIFWVDFPITQTHGAAPTVAPQTKPAHTALPEGEHTILYVEDNKFNQDLLIAILGRTPLLKLLIAENGSQGLAMAIEEQPDLILLDIGLPDMDGFTVLQQLRQHIETEHIPTVALSGNAMPHDIKKALQGGFTDYLTKPFNITALYQVLSQILSGAAKQKTELST